METRQDQDIQAQATNPEALLWVLRTRFQQAVEAEAGSRIEELEDLRFSTGEQWPTEVAQRRKQENRPCLVINQMPQFVRQVTNEQRQNRPMIRVLPVDDFSDVDTAKILQGLIRHIEVDSNADIAYDTAFEAAVRSGKGFFRVLTEYEDAKSFAQVLKIKRIRNRFTVYMDPHCQEPDAADAEWGMVLEEMRREAFVALYPDAQASAMTSWTSQGDGWVTADQVRICEYFFRQYTPQEIVLLSDGTVHERRYLKTPLPEGRTIVTTRTALLPIIWWVKSNGYEVLEQSRFPGQYIPIIPVIGDELDVNGELTYGGLVRHAKDAQRMYNYWASSETETIALAPRVPWIGVEGQFEGHEAEWQNANQRNYAYLEYKPKLLSGQLAPPPTRNVFEPPIQAITQARLMSRDDLKATTGIYDASLGNRSNETSGRAILARQREGDIANFHYIDNLARALKHCGRILIGIIPEVYSTRRIVRILGEDGTPETIQVNAPFKDQQGIDHLYDVRMGRYDVVVDVGPSYASKRQETVATMLELTKAFPALFQIAGDLLVKNMDWPGAQEIAERLQTLLPPEVRPKAQNGNPQQVIAQLQSAIPQLQQQLQAMNEYAKQCEAQGQQLAQENEQLKAAALTKTAELTLKQEETIAKVTLEQQKLQLEQQKINLEEQKIELEEQKVALEVAKAQMEMGEGQGRIEGLFESQQSVQALRENLIESQQALVQTMQAMQAHLQQVSGLFAETHTLLTRDSALRAAPKTVAITKHPDGSMSGTVMPMPQNGMMRETTSE